MGREDDMDEATTGCLVCGVEPEVYTENRVDEDGKIIVAAGTLISGRMCRDGTHFMCVDHPFVSVLEADTHRIADALDSMDAKFAAGEEDGEE